MPRTPRASKTAITDENRFVHETPGAPAVRKRRTARQTLTLAEVSNLQAQRAAAAIAAKELAEKARIDAAIASVKSHGFPTVFALLEAMDGSRDQQLSASLSRQISDHGRPLLDMIYQRQAEVIETYVFESAPDIIRREINDVCELLHPGDNVSVAVTLATFDLDSMLENAREAAPFLCSILGEASRKAQAPSGEHSRRNSDLVIITVLCMLAQARNEKSSHFQTTMGIYLLACGASRSQFDILNHAGLSLSYTSSIKNIKELGESKRRQITTLAHSQPCMIIWDNLNIAFRVGEQREASKDHFDNGTTATLIPLFGVPPGSLPLELKPPRTTRRPVIDNIGIDDLLPSPTQISGLEEEMRWQIEDILFDAFPDLRKRLADSIPAPPEIQRIPLHQTEQYPLPTMHIDESSLDGTLDVLRTIITDTLKMDAEAIQKHGIFFCAGDQLSISLLDKASASRRADVDLVDNVSRYTEGQLGLFHVKMAAGRMVANEFWGVPNSQSPWSLWRLNSLLGRKAISAGWTTKTPTPFRPTYDLILSLALPGHILEAFNCLCPDGGLEAWVGKVKDYNEIHRVTSQVFDQFCSARRVSDLRKLQRRDVPLENIILFIRDALILRALKHTIKRGEVGGIINILAYWMVMFRGTGKMPKYADALFQLLVRLRTMNPTLRDAFLNNWLANLSGRVDGFKEMDLLQEHQNFWAKIIYNARGSNRSWDWLAMVSVSIFALRGVIRQVQQNFQVPYNSLAHTSPDASNDVKHIRDYLQSNTLLVYTPDRPFNNAATPARDLFADGASYPNTAAAFKTFRRDTRTAENQGIPLDSDDESALDEDLLNLPYDTDELPPLPYNTNDLSENPSVDFDDLTLDSEEFPLHLDPNDIVASIETTIAELSMY